MCPVVAQATSGVIPLKLALVIPAYTIKEVDTGCHKGSEANAMNYIRLQGTQDISVWICRMSWFFDRYCWERERLLVGKDLISKGLKVLFWKAFQ